MSDTLLNLVNDILLMTGDYEKLTTVAGSPANIAERYMVGLNLTLKDAAKELPFPELETTLTAAGNGTDSTWAATGITAETADTVAVTVGKNLLEEITRRDMQSKRAANFANGDSLYFTRGIDPNGLLLVDIYPTPPDLATITLVASQSPSKFTLLDSSTTNILDDTLLILGAIAHADAFAGMDRGYMSLYTDYKHRTSTHAHRNEMLRVIPESYR